MIDAAIALSVAALLLAAVATRLRFTYHAAWGCVAGVALCLLVDAL